MKTQTVVIGAGPGGYAAAFRLAQMGKEVTLIEKEKAGGTCLNVGCIPSKALIAMAKKYEDIRNAAKWGIQISGEVKIDFSVTQKWKKGITEQLSKGILHLCKNNKVNFISGEARFVSPTRLAVKSQGSEQSLDFDTCVIATGSVPIAIGGFAFDGKKILSSTEGLDFEKIPERLAVIGGGYIGLEMGSLYAKLGSKVTVIEATPGLLPGFDRDCVAVIERQLRRDKVDVLVDSKASSYKETATGLLLQLDRKGEAVTLETDYVLVTVGRKPLSEGFDLEKAGLQKDERGYIPVNASLQTNVPHIYAIGDVARQPQSPPMLAHRATREAEVCAEHIVGKGSQYDARAMPAVVFTDPELATVGMQEEEAKKSGADLLLGKFPFLASAKSLISGHAEGFVKIVADKKSRAILGVQIVGHEAGTMISEAAALIEMGATIDDLALMIHPHPTAPEALMEAAKAALGEAIHIVNVK